MRGDRARYRDALRVATRQLRREVIEAPAETDARERLARIALLTTITGAGR